MADDQSYIPSRNNPNDYDDSYQRLIALKRRERRQRRAVILVGYRHDLCAAGRIPDVLGTAAGSGDLPVGALRPI